MSAARVYDYLLGGSTNFGPDREAAAALQRALPSAQRDVWANRAFLARAVAYLLDHGVMQFLDLGSGLPTAGNVHEVAHRRESGARVVYVDGDPVAVEHARDLLDDVGGVAVLEADLRDAEGVLNSPEVRDLLDFSRPIGVLAVAVLHFVARSDDPVSILSAYAEALAPGSHLVISHATDHTLDRDQAAIATAVYAGTDTPLTLRTPMQVAELFAGFSLVPPADGACPEVVAVSEWRPDPLEQQIETRTVYGGVGVLPEADGSTAAEIAVRSSAPATTPRPAVTPHAMSGRRS